MRTLRLLLLLVLPALLGSSCLSNEVHEVALGDHLLRYWQIARFPQRTGGRVYEFSATLERTGGDGARPVEITVRALDPGTRVLAGQLAFAPPMPGPVTTASPLRIRQPGSRFDPSALTFELVQVELPTLLASDPAPGEAVAPSAWAVLDFARPVPPAAPLGLVLDCAGQVTIAAHLVAPERLVLNPAGDLPAGTRCTVSWSDGQAPLLVFAVAAAGAPATVVYDRRDDGLFPPFPDDTYQVPDASRLTGRRNAVPPPASRPSDVVNLAQGLLVQTNQLDGWSPIAAVVLLLSEAPDLESLPRGAAESLDPLASIGLFDVDPASPRYGERHPFELSLRSESLPGDPVPTHQIILHPSRPLEPAGRYALAVTRRALAAGLRPFGADTYFLDALGEPVGGEHPYLAVTRGLLEEILPVLAEDVSPPLPSDDLALALSISVRSIDDVPRDVLAIRAQIDALASPPTFVIDSNVAGTGDVARVIRGRWTSPTWLQGLRLRRDAAGLPEQNGSREIPFVMTLPDAALDGPVPILMYQHGNPGSSDEVVNAGRRVAGAGFAAIGFTDFLNQAFADTVAQGIAIFGTILINRVMPEFYTETYGNQLAFLKLIQSLSLFEFGADGVYEVNPTLPITYEGISYGGVHGAAFVPYAPEIRAAALVASGGSFSERLFLQEITDPLGTGGFLLSTLPSVVPNLEVRDVWVGLQWFQAMYDGQDPNVHALFTYGPRRFPVDGTLRKASLLLVEGIDDSFSPNNATRSEAWATGPIPQLPPIAEPTAVLEPVFDPVNVANIDGETTAGLVQYVPWLNALPPSPGCEFTRIEGHYCAQNAPEAVDQRVAFYRSAVDEGVPTIFDPYYDGDGDGRSDAREVREGSDPGVPD